MTGTLKLSLSDEELGEILAEHFGKFLVAGAVARVERVRHEGEVGAMGIVVDFTIRNEVATADPVVDPLTPRDGDLRPRPNVPATKDDDVPF